MWTAVFAPRSAPSTRSAIEPATRSIPSSRAAPRAHSSAGPSSGSAPAAVCSGVPRTGHFSGRTTSSAPWAAAARVSRSAASRLRSRSGVELSWTAAARMRVDSSVKGRTASIAAVRMYKAWTWVGAFGPELMLCAAVARVGPARASWWAVWDGRAAARALLPPPRPGRRHAAARVRPRRARPACGPGRRRGRSRRARSGRRSARPRVTRHGARAAGRAGRARRRVGRLPRAGDRLVVVRRRGRARGRPAGDLEPGRRAPRRRSSDSERAVWIDGRAARTSRRSRSTASPASATCASARSRPARARRTTG